MSYFQQNSGQPPDKSTTMWSRPESEEQRKYFSKHAPERRVYGWIMVLFQIGHAALAFAAWSTLFAWALADYAFLLAFVPVLAVGTLFALHVLFRTTWETYWYDRLDNDPNTDSPLAVPVLIIVVLLACEVYGASKFLESKVEVAEVVDTRPISEEARAEVASLRREFSQDSARIERTYSEKTAAAAAPYDASIRRMRGQLAKAEGTNASWIRHLIAKEEEKREVATSRLKAEKAEKIDARATVLANAVDVARGRHENVLANTLSKNHQEEHREATEKAKASAYSWVVSILLLAIIAVLGWRRVRINVKSGIMPLHTYTVLDAHGSAVERVYTALFDAANRRWLQFAVWLHAKLSPKSALVSFDGTVVTTPGSYNTPSGGTSAPAPTAVPVPGAPAPHPTKTEEEARQEVAQKAAAAGVTLSPAQFRSEVEKSLASNGHYRDMPLNQNPTEPGEASAPATTGLDQAQIRKVLEGGMDIDDRMRQHRAEMESGDTEAAEKYKACYGALYGEYSELRKDLEVLGLSWGRSEDGQFLAGLAQSGQYYPVRGLLALPYISFPPMQQSDEGFLFKQTGELFKQIRNTSGVVIGLEYKGPRMAQTTTLSYAQVQSRISSYKNNVGRTDETRKKMLEVWNAALALFERDNPQPGVILAVEEEVGV